MNDQVNPKDILPFLDDLTKKAGSSLMSYFRREFRIEKKDLRVGGTDIVTDADKASEDIIVQAIQRQYPEHDILTEETQIDRIGSKWLWVVDPLDGTVNFSHGYPAFCVSIALMEEEQLIAGIVYDPLRQESFSAIRKGGAFLNGNLIRVSKTDNLNSSMVSTGFPYDKAFSACNNMAEFCKVLPKVQGLRRGGSAALDLAYVACGRLDGFWELKLKPWDMAAGILLVEEAGGVVSDRTGESTGIFTDSILATNGQIHGNLMEILIKVQKDTCSSIDGSEGIGRDG